jgi:hypothetical protein
MFGKYLDAFRASNVCVLVLFKSIFSENISNISVIITNYLTSTRLENLFAEGLKICL